MAIKVQPISRRLHNGVRIVNRPDPENVMRIDMGAMPMISDMETTGIRLDPTHLVTLHGRVTREMESLAAKVESQIGHPINIGSGDQLASLLFNELKLKQAGSRDRWTRSRKRLASDADILKGMLLRASIGKDDQTRGLLRNILDWKEREKLRSTYTLSLLAKTMPDKVGARILHTDFSSVGADTGRLTSSNPNLQNIPIRTDLGIEIRKAFIPRKGMVFGSADASQIEMRMNAHDAGCERMLNVFWDNEDIYWDNAELIFKRPFSSDERKHGLVDDRAAPANMQGQPFKKWYRQCAKIFALMVGYDASAPAVYDQFLSWGIDGWTEKMCADGLIEYFSRPDGYFELMARRKEHHRRAIQYGFVWDMWGRIRWIPQMKSTQPRIVGEGQRQAGNMAGQGGAAGAIKLWMAMVWDLLLYGRKQWHKHIAMLIQIHDELVCEGERAAVEDFQAESLHLMRNMMDYDSFLCPLRGSAETGQTGQSWGDLPH